MVFARLSQTRRVCSWRSSSAGGVIWWCKTDPLLIPNCCGMEWLQPGLSPGEAQLLDLIMLEHFIDGGGVGGNAKFWPRGKGFPAVSQHLRPLRSACDVILIHSSLLPLPRSRRLRALHLTHWWLYRCQGMSVDGTGHLLHECLLLEVGQVFCVAGPPIPSLSPKGMALFCSGAWGGTRQAMVDLGCMQTLVHQTSAELLTN